MGAIDCIYPLVKTKQPAPANSSAEQHDYLYVSKDSVVPRMWTSFKGV